MRYDVNVIQIEYAVITKPVCAVHAVRGTFHATFPPTLAEENAVGKFDCHIEGAGR